MGTGALRRVTLEIPIQLLVVGDGLVSQVDSFGELLIKVDLVGAPEDLSERLSFIQLANGDLQECDGSALALLGLLDLQKLGF